MILTISTYNPTYSGGELCGHALNQLDCRVIVTEEGTTIYDSGILTQYRHTINIPTTEVWESHNILVNITCPGYRTYTNLFTVYGYDLGDAIGFTNPFDFDIIMVEENYGSTTPPTRRVFASGIIYRKPFTDIIHFYNNVSDGAEVSWYDQETGDLLATGNSATICRAGWFEISIYHSLTEQEGTCCSGTVPTLIDECLLENREVPGFTWFPEHYVSYYANSCDDDCINNLNNNYTETRIDFSTIYGLALHGGSNPVPFYLRVDGSERSPIYHLDLIQAIYGIGSTIDENNKIIGITEITNSIEIEDFVDFALPVPQVTDSDYGAGAIFVYTWNNFTTPEVGDYILDNRLVMPNEVVTSQLYLDDVFELISCSKRYTIEVCNWLEIIQTDCVNYDVKNHSFDTVTLNLYKLNDTLTFVLEDTVDITQCNLAQVAIESDGVYKFEVIRGEQIENYIAINYCAIQNCYLTYLDKVICCHPTNDCRTVDTYNFNVFNMLVHVLMAQLNNEYNFNFTYSFLSPEKITDLYKISQLINRINTEYCLECNSPTTCNDSNVNISCTSCNS